MTEFNNINKFIPNTPKTYEVRYLEQKEVSIPAKLASYLGIKTAYACNKTPCYCIDVSKYSAAAQTAAVSMEIATMRAAQYGGTAQAEVNSDGTAKVTYEKKEPEKK